MPENRGRDIKGGLDPTTCLDLYEHIIQAVIISIKFLVENYQSSQ